MNEKPKPLSAARFRNFRGLEDLQLSFSPGINVVAGRNGAGKSSLLEGLAVLLSGLQGPLTASRETVRSFAARDIRQGEDVLESSLELQIGDIPLVYDRIDRREKLIFSREGNSGKRRDVFLDDEANLRALDSPTKIPETPLQIRKRIEMQGITPLAVYYSTRRTYLPSSQLRQRVSVQPREEAAAYAGALTADEVNFSDFGHYFSATRDLIAHDISPHLAPQLELFEARLRDWMPGFEDLRIQRSEGDKERVLVVSKNGKTLELSQLSDGEKSALALAMDLTRRLALLSDKETQGIVLIDEIDLHLHPKWQREILGRLESTFPNCQFIVSTHSPQVLGQAQPDNVIYLDRNAETGRIERVPVGASFGRDSNWILEEIMETPPRDAKTQQKIDAIFDLVDEGDLETARKEIVILRNEIGGEAELDRAEGHIDRVEILADIDEEDET